MTSRQSACADRGSAALEFVAGALVLLVPCVYAVLCFGALESATFATEGAARNAARLYVDQPTAAQGAAAARRAVLEAFPQSGATAGPPRMRIACSGACAAPGGIVTVTVTTRVALPFLPQWPAVRRLTSIAVSASASQTTARFGVPNAW